MSESLLIHAVVPRSRANGPGERMTVWVQGCTLGCDGCFNPGTHPAGGSVRAGDQPGAGFARGGERPGAGFVRGVDELLDLAAAAGDRIEGVTLTGGEPLEQAAAVAAFGAGLKRRTGLGLIILTGFARREIESDAGRMAAVADADLVVAGRYQRRAHVGGGLRGSANKAYWWRTERYRRAELDAVPELEVLVAADGTLTITGMAAPGIG